MFLINVFHAFIKSPKTTMTVCIDAHGQTFRGDKSGKTSNRPTSVESASFKIF